MGSIVGACDPKPYYSKCFRCVSYRKVRNIELSTIESPCEYMTSSLSRSPPPGIPDPRVFMLMILNKRFDASSIEIVSFLLLQGGAIVIRTHDGLKNQSCPQ